jgi:adenine-specific DNA-methyltransferase
MNDSHVESTATPPTTTDQPERVDLRSHDIAGDKQAEIARLFPEVRTEGGKIDFDRLKRALGASVDPGKERYGMHWPGKADCFKAIQSPSLGTLLPCHGESVNFGATGNVIIEGDNLEVLKLLQKSYLGKIKMIYIDPPYNTGSDFIYPDNYTESLRTYLEYTGQMDAEGKRFSTNTEADGRFHSKWLSMMYPRLFLARNLLAADGLVFISIDDNEQHHLRILMNDIFGEENFIAQIVWKKKYIGGKHARHIVDLHEYVLVFAKNTECVAELLIDRPADEQEKFDKEDEYLEERGRHYIRPLKSNLGERKTLVYPIELPDGTTIETQWMVSRKTFDSLVSQGRIVYKQKVDGTYQVYRKFYEKDNEGLVKFPSIIDDVANSDGKLEFKKLFDVREGRDIPFENPKPSKLVRLLAKPVTSGNDIVLDFFAGSGTTAHAVLELNKEDSGNRKFILVQLPEPTGREDYPTIAAITRERVRRVIEELDKEKPEAPLLVGTEKPDRGFRAYRLAESNFRVWDVDSQRSNAESVAQQLSLHVNHLVDGRTSDDLLCEMLLKSGFSLSTLVDSLTISGKTVSSIAEGAMLICLERELTSELIRAIAERKPQRVILLDEGFAGNDQLKTNAVQIMKTKGVTSFRTV